MNILLCTPTSVSVELCNGDAYYTEPYEIYLNNTLMKVWDRNVFSLYHLRPGETYELRVEGKKFSECVNFRTRNLKERIFQTANDGGEVDETAALQSAIDSLQADEFLTICGTYKITALFLKDNVCIHLTKDSRLIGETKREAFPILRAEEEANGVVLGTWEGEADDSFASILTGIGVKNVCIYGEGIIDCNAQNSD